MLFRWLNCRSVLPESSSASDGALSLCGVCRREWMNMICQFMIWLPPLLGHENMWLCYSKLSEFYRVHASYQIQSVFLTIMSPGGKCLYFREVTKGKFMISHAFQKFYTFGKFFKQCDMYQTTQCCCSFPNLVSNGPQMKRVYTWQRKQQNVSFARKWLTVLLVSQSDHFSLCLIPQYFLSCSNKHHLPQCLHCKLFEEVNLQMA